MTGLPPLREVIAEHNLSANKALGQNFLLDEQLLRRIARIAGPLENANVLEVGPGPGGLTRALLREGARVIAIEKDQRCLSALTQLEQAFPGKLKIIEGDALSIDANKLFDNSFMIISNLPYNIGTALLTKWLSEETWPPLWSSLTLMFQHEVAKRIVASPGTADYGRLSVLAQWRSKAKIAMKVHRSAFTPPPKVMSAMVHITPDIMPDGVHIATLEQLTRTAFGQRRKMLRQSLKSLPQAIEALDFLGIDASRRAETLSVEEFTKIARVMN